LKHQRDLVNTDEELREAIKKRNIENRNCETRCTLPFLTAAVKNTRNVSRACGNTVTAIFLASALLFLLVGTVKDVIPALRIIQRNDNVDLQYNNVSLFRLCCIPSITFFGTFSDYYHHKHVTVPQTFCVSRHACCTKHRLQRVATLLADSTEVSLELQITDLLICRACHRHNSHFMCLCAKYNKKYFGHKGKLGTSIYAFCRRGETWPYNGTLQTYGTE
jgi:hypothetical protein